MGYTDFSLGSLISTYWPVILIVMGIKRFLAPDEQHSRFSATLGGFLFLALGVFFLGRNLDWFYYSAGDFFKMLIPVMLIGGGLSVIFKPRPGTRLYLRHRLHHRDTIRLDPVRVRWIQRRPLRWNLRSISSSSRNSARRLAARIGTGMIICIRMRKTQTVTRFMPRRIPAGRRSRSARNEDATSVRNGKPAVTANGMRSFRIPDMIRTRRTARLLSAMCIWARSIFN